MITLSKFNSKKLYCSSPYVVDRLYHHIKCFDLEKIFVNNLKRTFSEHEKHYTHFEFQVLFSRKTKSYYLNIFKCKNNPSKRSLIKESKKVVFNSKITSFRDDIYDDLYRHRYYKRSYWQGNYNYSDEYYRKICFLKKKKCDIN